jgi:nuclear pore complex protein Nup62
MLATDLQAHLDDLSTSLTQMIESVNALTQPSETLSGSDQPMSQIAQILSSHLESLQWIDGAVRDVEGQMAAVEKGMKENGIGANFGNSQKRGGFSLR